MRCSPCLMCRSNSPKSVSSQKRARRPRRWRVSQQTSRSGTTWSTRRAFRGSDKPRSASEQKRAMKKKLSVAVVGAGMGGLAVAATLRRVGIDVRVYEQAVRFARIGAGIQMMPNSMKVLRGIGIEQRLRESSFAPYSHLNRIHDSGEINRELPIPESLYDAPYLCMHRGDLHDALLSTVPAECVHTAKKLVGLDQANGCVRLSF